MLVKTFPYIGNRIGKDFRLVTGIFRLVTGIYALIRSNGGRKLGSRRLRFFPREHVIQLVEHDLVLKPLIIGSAVSLAALLRGDDMLRLGTGQLVVELLTVNSQLALALSANIKIRARDLVLPNPTSCIYPIRR
jgi:hypothetical protein